MLKNKLAFIAALTICCGVFTACGSKSSSSESASSTEALTTVSEAETTTQAASESGNKQTSGSGQNAEITPETAKGGDITGQWIPEGFDSGLDAFLDFGADGTGTVFVDVSKMVQLSDGKFSAMGIEAEKDNLVIKDDSVSAYYNSKDEDSLIIRLERTDGSSSGSLDGEYAINGGKLSDIIYTYLDGSFGGDASKLPLKVVIDGSTTLLKVDGAFTYITEGNRLEIAVMDELKDMAEGIIGKELYYTASKDTLTISADDSSIVMPRREK